MRRLAILALVAALPAAANPPSAPYAGLESRPVKALSATELADLRAGRGMGLALAAELNAYPGPLHVLEHAAALGLEPAQRARAEALMAAMRADAIAAGERLIAAEAALDAVFAGGTATPDAVAAATGATGAAQARLRAVHLVAHLGMRDALTPAQIAQYGALRGYAAVGDGHAHGNRAKH